MTFVLSLEPGRIVDVDRLWTELVAGLAPSPGPIGRASLALGIAVGLRLGLDQPTLAKAMTARLEVRMATDADITAEQAEVTIRELIDMLSVRAEAK